MNLLAISRLLIVPLFLSSAARADEFRFQCMGEVTGLCDRVWGGDGKETTIKLAELSETDTTIVHYRPES